MKKLDLKKELKAYYLPPRKPAILKIPCFQFAMIDGAIEKGKTPGDSQGFGENMQALYGISYTLKFMLKKRKENPIDYPVMALEGLWWVEDGQFDLNVKDNWFYTVMILQPTVVSPESIRGGIGTTAEKTRGFPCPGALAAGGFRGRAVRPGHAHRPVCHGTGNHRGNARLCRRERLPRPGRAGRQAPRDLHGRSAQSRPCKAQDRIETPCGKSRVELPLPAIRP